MKNETLLGISWFIGEIFLSVILVTLAAERVNHPLSHLEAGVLGIGFVVFYALTMYVSGFVVTFVAGARPALTKNAFFYGFMAGISGLLSSCLIGQFSLALLAAVIFCAVFTVAQQIGNLLESKRARKG